MQVAKHTPPFILTLSALAVALLTSCSQKAPDTSPSTAKQPGLLLLSNEQTITLKSVEFADVVVQEGVKEFQARIAAHNSPMVLHYVFEPGNDSVKGAAIVTLRGKKPSAYVALVVERVSKTHDWLQWNPCISRLFGSKVERVYAYGEVPADKFKSNDVPTVLMDGLVTVFSSGTMGQTNICISVYKCAQAAAKDATKPGGKVELECGDGTNRIYKLVEFGSRRR